MNKDIRNYDENDNLHGVQIDYHSNGNICWIVNYHHGKRNGYIAWFYKDKTIEFKGYCNMDKLLYSDSHSWNNQIEIKI